MRTEDELSGLPWGGLNLKHVISKGRSQEDSRREGSRMDENRSNYYAAEEAPVYDDRYETHSNTHYEGEDPIYWSGSGSGHGGSSR
jgi:hypothetical protein